MSLHKSYYTACPLQVTDIPKTVPLFLGFYTTVEAGGKQLFLLDVEPTAQLTGTSDTVSWNAQSRHYLSPAAQKTDIAFTSGQYPPLSPSFQMPMAGWGPVSCCPQSESTLLQEGQAAILGHHSFTSHLRAWACILWVTCPASSGRSNSGSWAWLEASAPGALTVRERSIPLCPFPPPKAVIWKAGREQTPL